MPWSAQHDAKTNTIEIIYTGVLTLADLQAAITKRISLQEETGATCILADLSGIEHSDIGTVDLFSIPAEYFVSKQSSRRTRVGLVLPQEPKAREDARFYETVCLNRGWQFKAFEQRHEALKWLIMTEPSNKPDAGDGK